MPAEIPTIDEDRATYSVDTDTPRMEAQRSTSSLSNHRQSALYQQLGRRGSRNVSAPVLTNQMVESPIEMAPASDSRRSSRQGPSPVPGNTLLSKRDSMLKKKMSGAFYAPFNSTPNLAATPEDHSNIHDASSMRNVQLGEPEAEDIPLAERKQLIDQENMTLSERKRLVKRASLQGQMSQQQQPQGTWPVPQPVPQTLQLQNFDSHQPRRGGIDRGKQEVMLASWRESLRQELTTAQTPVVDEQRRQALITNRRAQQQQQAIESTIRTNAMDSVMRRGDMISAHKEAMRKMQASANEHV